MADSERQMLMNEVLQKKSDAECPEVLQNKSLSIKNHRICIIQANLGPANPRAPETIFWILKSTKWNISENAARQMLCGNCGHYWKTKFIDDCMKKYEQVTPPEVDPSWVDTNDSVGYCDEWDIPCTASRTCDTWEPGGPITAALVAMNELEDEDEED
jgi:hypothetical protein